MKVGTKSSNTCSCQTLSIGGFPVMKLCSLQNCSEIKAVSTLHKLTYNPSQNILRPMLNDLILCCFSMPPPALLEEGVKINAVSEVL